MIKYIYKTIEYRGESMARLLEETISQIKPSDKETMKKTQAKIDNLTKPIGSLGELENIAVKFSGITGKLENSVHKKNIIIMCADNGVVEEGVSACPKEITTTVTNNFTRKITGVGVLGAFTNTELTVVDIGVDSDSLNSLVLDRKIAYGTKNIAREAAMTREEAIRAIEVGIKIVDNLANGGVDLLGTGEMGIGNTTTSIAVLSALTGIESDILCGKGSGLTDAQFEKKKETIKRAIKINNPDRSDTIDVIQKVGGLDIAGLCGCFLSAAKNRVPIVIDGLIASIAALCAYRINSDVVDYIFPSHLSSEPGAKYILDELGLKAMLNLNMRLGEGSGCPLAFNIIEASVYTMKNMGTFEEANIVNDFLVDIREEN